jgi:hypothetical protein
MFLLDEILLPHALDSIVLIILFILTEHDLSKGSPAKHFKQLEFFKSTDVIHIALILEYKLAFSLHLFVLLDRFRVQVKRVDGVHFLLVLIDIVNGCGVVFEG